MRKRPPQPPESVEKWSDEAMWGIAVQALDSIESILNSGMGGPSTDTWRLIAIEAVLEAWNQGIPARGRDSRCAKH